MKIVFVGGTGRCGTTVLWKMLSGHPNIVSLPVRHRFIIDPDGILDFINSVTRDWSPFAVDRATERLDSLMRDVFTPSADRYQHLALEKYLPDGLKMYKQFMSKYIYEYEAQWIGNSRKRHKMAYIEPAPHGSRYILFRNLIEMIFDPLFAGYDKRWFVDGDTWNILYADRLLRMFPTAKLIHIIRDPRDVVSSMSHQGWCPRDPKAAAFYYTSIMDRWFDMVDFLPPHRVLTVRLEELCVNQSQESFRIRQFLGIPNKYRMDEFDLSRPNIGRWKDDGWDDAPLRILERFIVKLEYA